MEQGQQQVAVVLVAGGRLAQRLVLGDGGQQLRSGLVRAPVRARPQQDGQVAAGRDEVRIQGDGAPVDRQGAGPILVRAVEPAERVVLEDVAVGVHQRAVPGRELGRPPGLRPGGLAQPGLQQGQGVARVVGRDPGVGLDELAVQAERPGQLAGLAQAHRAVLEGEIHLAGVEPPAQALADRGELGRRDAPLAGVQDELDLHPPVRGAPRAPGDPHGAEGQIDRGRQRPRLEARGRPDQEAEQRAVGQRQLQVELARARAALRLLREQLGQVLQQAAGLEHRGRRVEVRAGERAVGDDQPVAEGLVQGERIGPGVAVELAAQVGLLGVVGEHPRQLGGRGVLGEGAQVLLDAPAGPGGLDDLAGAEVRQLVLADLGVGALAALQRGQARQLAGVVVDDQGQPARDGGRELARGDEAGGGIDPQAGLAGDVHDGVVEAVQRGQVRVDVHPAAGPHQRQPGVDAGLAERGHQQHGLVLAVAEAAAERLGGAAGQQGPVADLQARVADPRAQGGQAVLDQGEALEDRGQGQEREAGGLLRRWGEQRLGVSRVPARHGPPGVGQGQQDQAALGHLGRREGLEGWQGRQRAGAELEALHAARVGDQGLRRQPVGLPAHRRGRGGLDHQAAGLLADLAAGEAEADELPGPRRRAELPAGVAELGLGADLQAGQGRAQQAAIGDQIRGAAAPGGLGDAGGVEEQLAPVGSEHPAPELGFLLEPGLPADLLDAVGLETPLREDLEADAVLLHEPVGPLEPVGGLLLQDVDPGGVQRLSRRGRGRACQGEECSPDGECAHSLLLRRWILGSADHFNRGGSARASPSALAAPGSKREDLLFSCPHRSNALACPALPGT